MTSSPTSTDATVILDMNDKFFVEVFKYLKLPDLCTVAEVCRRFRQNAKACFECSKKTDLILVEDIKSDGDSVDQIVFKTSKVLRYFGAYFKKFDGDDFRHSCVETYWIGKTQAECQRRILELLIRYCSGTLTELTIFAINVKDEMVPLIKPLLEGLQILKIKFIRTGQEFLDTLPL